MIMKIFQVNETDYYRAEDVEQAIQAVMKHCGFSREQIQNDCRDGLDRDTPIELTPEDLEKHEVTAEDEDTMTMAEALRREDEAGLPAGFFCSEDY